MMYLCRARKKGCLCVLIPDNGAFSYGRLQFGPIDYPNNCYHNELVGMAVMWWRAECVFVLMHVMCMCGRLVFFLPCSCWRLNTSIGHWAALIRPRYSEIKEGRRMGVRDPAEKRSH